MGNCADCESCEENTEEKFIKNPHFLLTPGSCRMFTGQIENGKLVSFPVVTPLTAPTGKWMSQTNMGEKFSPRGTVIFTGIEKNYNSYYPAYVCYKSSTNKQFINKVNSEQEKKDAKRIVDILSTAVTCQKKFEICELLATCVGREVAARILAPYLVLSDWFDGAPMLCICDAATCYRRPFSVLPRIPAPLSLKLTPLEQQQMLIFARGCFPFN